MRINDIKTFLMQAQFPPEDAYATAHRLDATSGQLANVTLGYSATEIKEAIAAQLDVLPYYAAFRGTTNLPAEELSRTLIEDWFGFDGMARVCLDKNAVGSDRVTGEKLVGD